MRWDRSKGKPEPIRLLNRIREEENGEPLVHLPDVAPKVRIGRASTIPYCRESVARLAGNAAELLPPGMFLAVTDAWRPIERQQRIYEWMTECAKEAFPDLPYAALRRRVNRWVAPYDQKAPPGHCTGGALDVALVDEAGEFLDVSSPFSRFAAAPTYSLGLNPEALERRMILVEAMLEVGFSNCRDEWWHYSYGDAGWAVRRGLDVCYYGLATLDPSVYADKEQAWLEALRERTNPFLPGGSAASAEVSEGQAPAGAGRQA